MKGSNGGWKDFLTVYDKKVGISLSDRARRTPEALIAFLNGFSNDDDLKVIGQWNIILYFDSAYIKKDLVLSSLSLIASYCSYLFPIKVTF